MRTLPTTRVVRLLPIVEGLKNLGHPAERELRLAGLPVHALDQPTFAIPVYRFWSFAEQASLRSGHLALLAHSIENTSFRNSLVSGVVLPSSDTLARLLDSFCRYVPREAPFTRFWIETRGEELWFRFEIRGVDEARANVFLEIGAIAWMQRFVRTVVPFWRPERVFVRKASVGDLAKQLELLGWRDVAFRTGINGFPIPHELLSARKEPSVSGPISCDSVSPAEQMLQGLRSPGSLAESLRMLIITYRRDEWLSVLQAAEIAEMSPRALQLRLAEEGLTFRRILDDCRMQVAVSMLQSSDCPLEEIASETGYGDRPAFIRAFRRWARVSPMQFRQQQQRRA